MESGTRKLQSNPRKKANPISVLFFGWTVPFFRRTYGKILDSSDVSEPLEEDQSRVLGNRLERKWREECDKKAKPSLLKAIAKTFWPEYLLIGMLNLISDVVSPLLVPYLLKHLLEYFRKDSDMSQNDALAYGTAIFIMTILPGIASSHSLFKVFCSGTKVRVAICSLIYHKSLRLSQTALSDTAPGKLVNLLSNDVNRYELVSYTINSLWTSPLMAIIATFILWREAGWAGIFGLLIILSVVPLQGYTGKLSTIIRFKIAHRTDERVRFMDEIISGVQVIKMYAWEKSFAKLIAAARRSEMTEILKSGYIRAIFMTLNLFMVRLALFCTILATILLHDSEKIRVSKIFMVSYLLMGISNSICRMFARAIAETGEALVATRRLQIFLEYEEKDQWSNDYGTVIDSDPSKLQNISILMTNVSVGWIKSSGPNETVKSKNAYKSDAKQNDSDVTPFKLKELNLEIPKGKLVFVIGQVGVGKSTLIQALLHELPLECGKMEINGTISYACQESWIFASTVRQNITFGLPMDRSRYDEVVQCTALKTDFAQLSGGDMTMVGENGTGLSGGQKARINLARAVYKNADIYLIDDPLSAVDTHVQSHLFNNCIGPNGFLARQNATRILVTHQVHFLNEADWIIVLKDGRIETQGTYSDILKSGINIASMSNKNDENTKNKIADIDGTINIKRNASNLSLLSSEKSFSGGIGKNDSANEENQLLNELEVSSDGTVKESVLMSYLKSANRPCMLVFLIISILLSQILVSLADVWISYWIRLEESRTLEEPKTVNITLNLTSFELTPDKWSTILCTYIGTGIVASLFVIAFIRSIVFYKFSATASQNLHDTMFNGLITTTMRFFDTNPSGRILNRFSKDMGSSDEALPKAVLDSTQINLTMVGAICVTISTNVEFSIVILILIVVFWFVRKIYLKSSTNIKRLEGTTKSPVFSHISATLSGLPTIRAFNAEKLLQQEFDDHQDLNTGAYFMFLSTSSGFGMSLDLMIYIFLGCVIYAFILMNEGITGDKVGLAITQSLSLTSNLQWGVRQSAEVTNLLTSVERILEYSKLEPEKQPELPAIMPNDWPSQGKIEFKNVFYRYSIDSEPVLKGLSFSVEPCQKVSVVGRTGAGKSSLIGSIFRLAIVGGEILIDSVDTSCVDLNVLRSRISIIPQEPTLFSGTLRTNLDPFEEYSDDEIWNALEDVGMKEIISDGNGLQMSVLARGQNFSTGQRQILCLARAILRKNRIIILDEATANVDQRTDLMIQETIRRKFNNCTVLVVAHRLNTIIDSDRVLVMDAGVAVEFDKPHNLLQNEKGVFYGMVQALGPQEFKRLSDMAQKYK